MQFEIYLQLVGYEKDGIDQNQQNSDSLGINPTEIGTQQPAFSPAVSTGQHDHLLFMYIFVKFVCIRSA